MVTPRCPWLTPHRDRRVEARDTHHRRANVLLGRVCTAVLGDQVSFPHDQDTVAHSEDLRQLTGDHQDAQALLRQLADQAVDLGLRTHVHPARGLVHDEQLWLSRQPLADNDLLLVAARELAHYLLAARCADAQLLDGLEGQLAFRGAIDEPGAHQASQHGHGDVLPDLHLANQTLRAPIFRDIRDAHLHGLRWTLDLDGLALQQDGARVRGQDAEHDLCELAPPGTHQTCKAHDLTGAYLEADIQRLGPAGEVADFEDILTDLGGQLGEQVLDGSGRPSSG